MQHSSRTRGAHCSLSHRDALQRNDAASQVPEQVSAGSHLPLDSGMHSTGAMPMLKGFPSVPVLAPCQFFFESLEISDFPNWHICHFLFELTSDPDVSVSTRETRLCLATIQN
jgi:hypothetical protein